MKKIRKSKESYTYKDEKWVKLEKYIYGNYYQKF